MNNISINVEGGEGTDIKARRIRRLVEEAMEDILDFAHQAAVSNAPRRTGNLQRNITTSDVSRTGNLYRGHLSVRKTAPYAEFVHGGTGLFGPYRTPIVSPRGNIMKWQTNRIRTTTVTGRLLKRAVRYKTDHYAKRVRGQKAQPFLKVAYVSAQTFYAPARFEVLKAEIRAVIEE